MKRIPITNNFVNKLEGVIGHVDFNDTAKANFVYEMLKTRPDSFRFEIGYSVDEDGKYTLHGVSLVNKYPEYHPVILKRRAEDYLLRVSRKVKKFLKD